MIESGGQICGGMLQICPPDKLFYHFIFSYEKECIKMNFELKIYVMPGVNQYRKFLIRIKQSYDHFCGRPDTDNYFDGETRETGTSHQFFRSPFG